MSRPRKPPRDWNAEIPGLAARRGALRLLTSVLHQGRPLDAALAGALNGIDRPDDRALARNLASGVLRWLVDLDALIDSATERPLPDDARARMALRIGLAGHLLLGTPPHAVVATTLELTEGGPRRLTHAVLSRLLREGAALPEAPTLPGGYALRWEKAWGPATVAAAARALGAEPATDLSLKDATATAHWTGALGGATLAPGHVRLVRKGALAELPGFDEGAWWVQDLGASLPARLLPAAAGTSVLDLCAAPGGKTLQLAARGCVVTALDTSDARLERVRENLGRMGLTAEIVAADALAWRPETPFDFILLDAPCSASGVFRRHPDVLHLKDARDVKPLLAVQAQLLDRACEWLTPGGTLVFSTCSLEPAEGESQLSALLERRGDMRIDAVHASELPAGLTPHAKGWVRTLPGDLEQAGGIDGFFVARLKKASGGQD
jgi:16S rRNA (cytosine967-C5)-methyltransferase